MREGMLEKDKASDKEIQQLNIICFKTLTILHLNR